MLNGAKMAIDEANAAGGYGGKPFRLITHNDYDNWQISSAATGVSKDSAIWGSASNDAVRMIYDDKVWAMFGSISSESTHIALRLTLKAETPLVNSASTDPTIPETIIPWYHTVLQDDRVQGYTLARHIYTDLGLKRVAILRVNDRYGRFGVLKFKDASRRLGHPVVIEQKFMRGDSDFRHQLQLIEDSRVDAIVLWTDIEPAAMILEQMQERFLIRLDVHLLARCHEDLEEHALIGAFDLHLHLNAPQKRAINQFVGIKIGWALAVKT